MIKFMHKHAKFFYVFLFLIIISFIFLYIGPIHDEVQSTPIIEIGKKKIYPDEFWKTYENLENRYRQMYKEKFDEKKAKELNIVDQTIMGFVADELMFSASKKAGIVTSHQELNDAIVNDQLFVRDGVFSKDIYLNTLKLNGLSPKTFENMRSQQLSMAKMKNIIELSTTENVELDESIKSMKDANEEMLSSLKESLLKQKYNKLIAAYVDGFSKTVPIVVRRELIATNN
ncbi:MAG: SurA N-terminal domain-containing protein [Candidatus Magnetoovum sp. WYHC-5]|nr:SurA N-terminal domain-containing protein [Candidatus Magnetoovum sp. WYHC-5]